MTTDALYDLIGSNLDMERSMGREPSNLYLGRIEWLVFNDIVNDRGMGIVFDDKVKHPKFMGLWVYQVMAPTHFKIA